jgi:hypothetical protein
VGVGPGVGAGVGAGARVGVGADADAGAGVDAGTERVTRYECRTGFGDRLVRVLVGGPSILSVRDGAAGAVAAAGVVGAGVG